MSMGSSRISTGPVDWMDCGIDSVLDWMSMDSPRTSLYD